MTGNANQKSKENLAITDLNLFMLGINLYKKAQGLTASFGNVAEPLPPIPDDIFPLKEVQLLGSLNHIENLPVDTLLAYAGQNSDVVKKLDRLKGHFQNLGMSSAFDDGVLTKEELLLASAARGNYALKENSELYQNIDQDIYDKAEAVLSKHNITDLNGTLMRGIAVQSVRLTAQANQGLGFNSNGITLETIEPSPYIQTPEMAVQ